MKQPYEALPLQRKAQQHEATLYSGAAVRGKNLDTRKELYLRAVEANCQKLNTVVEKQRETVSDAAAGATPRSGSERRGERGRRRHGDARRGLGRRRAKDSLEQFRPGLSCSEPF